MGYPADVSTCSPKCILESLDRSRDGILQLVQSNHDANIIGDFLHCYLNREVSIHLYFSFRSHSLDTESGDFKLILERVCGYVSHVADGGGSIDLNQCGIVGNNSSNDMQLSMPVFPGTIVNQEQIVAGSLFIRPIGSLVSIARLYSLKPQFEFLGQWNSVEGCLFIVLGLPRLENRELQ